MHRDTGMKVIRQVRADTAQSSELQRKPAPAHFVVECGERVCILGGKHLNGAARSRHQERLSKQSKQTRQSLNELLSGRSRHPQWQSQVQHSHPGYQVDLRPAHLLPLSQNVKSLGRSSVETILPPIVPVALHSPLKVTSEVRCSMPAAPSRSGLLQAACRALTA